MACQSPNHIFVVGKKENGKKEIVYTSPSINHLEKTRSGSFIQCETSFISSLAMEVYYPTLVPCGQCTMCRLEYSRQWANRCMLEAQQHKDNYFVTLTYNPEHLTYNPHVDYETGEIEYETATLVKADLQNFFKRLRRYYYYNGCHSPDWREMSSDKDGNPRFYDNNLRYYACGEYGDKSGRPHYHILLFGCELDDLQPAEVRNGIQYYSSAFLQKVWSLGGDDLGIIRVGELNWNSCAYVARYVMKKRKGKGAQFYLDQNIEPEYVVMSRRPGIAWQFYDDNKSSIYETDSISISDPLKGGIKFKPPRYFDGMYDVENPDGFLAVKIRREDKMLASHQQIESHTDISYEDYLAVQGRKKEKQIKALRRTL